MVKFIFMRKPKICFKAAYLSWNKIIPCCKALLLKAQSFQPILYVFSIFILMLAVILTAALPVHAIFC